MEKRLTILFTCTFKSNIGNAKATRNDSQVLTVGVRFGHSVSSLGFEAVAVNNAIVQLR